MRMRFGTSSAMAEVAATAIAPIQSARHEAPSAFAGARACRETINQREDFIVRTPLEVRSPPTPTGTPVFGQASQDMAQIRTFRRHVSPTVDIAPAARALTNTFRRDSPYIKSFQQRISLSIER